ncbi:MAG: hypothetical protein GF317_17145 [Candidatus Lokiarchaeota archaeon]|nr:hypothetical protein [Candidatus Lokiarchaeota archaeon]MBD3201239.1 hypothetical protein [Candidatus Lokiarchaeota archaeon]
MAVSNKTSKKSVNISKGIIYIFVVIYLIIIGIYFTGFIDTYQAQNPGDLPVFVRYVPLAFYLGSGFVGISFIIFIRNITSQKTKELKSRKKVSTSLYKQALFLIIFIFAFIPIFSPIIDGGVNDHNFSIYNSGWNGASDFRKTVQNEGFEVMSIQSSLSATERLNKSALLVLLGPNQYYNPLFEIPYFVDFFSSGRNSLLLCHDHGTTSTLLWEIFIASALNLNSTENIPVTLFPDGYLRDNASYDTNPLFPIITQFDDPNGYFTSGVNEILLSKASAAAGGPLVDQFGWKVLARSSESYSYVDKNLDGQYNYDDDYLDLTFMAGAVPIPEEYLKLPLGHPFTPAVFMYKDLGNSRVFVSSDASLWNNELINQAGYDNKQLAVNVINWLTRQDQGDSKNNWIIAYDEAHIRPEYSRDLSSAGIYGFIMQYIIHLSTNPITAWIYPLLAIYSLRKYLPKKDEKKEKKKIQEEEEKEEKIRFRTSSFFAKKIEWYREKNQYKKALLLLNRRLDRKLHTQLGDKKITTDNVINLVTSKEPNINKSKLKRISKFMDTIIATKYGKNKIKDEIEFEELFFEMEWVVNNI